MEPKVNRASSRREFLKNTARIAAASSTFRDLLVLLR